ncbi:hypothetical protein C6341_g18736 [Phytophthora cactorum]|nr:hypothetical protein C6341_g18736 [Phytophthora cactorum]
MAKSDASRLRKGLPWLKHLQAALNNDDSSDSSSQPTQVTPKKVGKTTVKEEGREVSRRSKKKRLRRDEGDSSEDTSSGESDGAKEMKRRQPKKVVKVRRKRSLDEARKKGKSHVESAKTKAAALRGQRMKKLHAMRVTSGEHDRMAAFKLKRQKSAEALKDKERNRMRAIRAARGAQNVSTGVDADVEDEGEPRRRPRLQPAADKDTAAKTVKRRANTSKKSKPKQTDPATLALEKAPDSVKDEADDDSEVKSLALAEGLLSDLGKHVDDDDKTEDLATCAIPKTPEGKDGDSSGIIRSTPAGPAKPEDSAGRSSAAMKVKSSERETTESNVKVEPEASEGAKSERGSQVKPEGADADAIKITPSSTSNGTSVESSRPESEDQVKTEPLVPAEGAAELVKDEIKEEEQTEPFALTALSVKLEDEKKLGEEKLPLDEVPIPRKAPKEGESAVPPSSTGSFVIPKRTFVKSDTAGHKAKPQVKPAATTEATVSDVKRSLKSPRPVTMLPLASPQSSPNWPKDEPTHSQRKRTKNPVPVKRSSFSTQDRALMRLSRKRNSIFMAAAELTAQVSDIKSSKTTRMMGYEVYDVDGKTLPDLISRLSCATKREMATDRESYVASFFGVSRTAPKAKRELSSVSGGCGGTDLDPREMNCYEELCFERPEDREFYQRKMYGTAFVPQNLRGWITLIVRNARFERKSTGIRFNQDRDREQFAATLSQRYTFNKSVPRCDIPRENWQNLMRNKPATVYLHYYNREDAERAAQVFRDDLGQPLQIRWELKAVSKVLRNHRLFLRTMIARAIRHCGDESAFRVIIGTRDMTVAHRQHNGQGERVERVDTRRP